MLACLRARVGAAAIALVASAPLAAQQTLTVSGGGAALQAAVDAASPGDSLDVFAGSYDPIVVTKGIHVFCRPGVRLAATGFTQAGASIERVPAGETFTLAGGEFSAGSILATALQVEDCAGTVIVRGALDLGGNGFAFGIRRCTGPVHVRAIFDNIGGFFESGEIRDCNQVSVSGSRIDMTIYCVNSSVAISGSDLPFGLRVQAGRVSVVGAGNRITGPFQISGIGYPAIELRGGQLTLAGELDVFSIGFVPPAAISTTGGRIRIAPTVTLTTGAQPPITGPAAVGVLDLPAIDAPGVVSGGTLNAVVRGEPNSRTATFVEAPLRPVPTPLGELWVLPTSPVLDVGVLDANGRRSFQAAVPLPRDTVLTVQTLTLTTANQLLVGPATRLVID